MKFVLLLGLIMVIGITTCGCTQPASVSSPDITPSPTLTMDQPISTPDLSVVMLSDEQPNITLSLPPGVILLSFETSEPQFLKISQHCGKTWEEFSEERSISPYKGKIAFSVPEQGDCTFNISSTGAWTAELSWMDMSNPLAIPVNLSGSGTDVSPAFTLEKGEYIFQREETEGASPRYELMDANGSALMDVSNSYAQPAFERFSNETFRIITVPQTGTYFLSAFAWESDPNPWNASIIAIPTAPEKGPGPEISK